jgi:hypothetical protein
MVQQITVLLACGHVVTSLPYWLYQQQNQIICEEMVERVVPGCDHKVYLRCSIDITADSFLSKYLRKQLALWAHVQGYMSRLQEEG